MSVSVSVCLSGGSRTVYVPDSGEHPLGPTAQCQKRVQEAYFHLLATEILQCVCVRARACVCLCRGVFVGDKKGDMSPWALHRSRKNFLVSQTRRRSLI